MEYTLIAKLKCTKPYVVYATRRFRQEMGAELEEQGLGPPNMINRRSFQIEGKVISATERSLGGRS